ncbi:MAG: ribosome maturation factor RimM [Actinomycetia bacterium]|nr:ribosome maturation factor RimM [Actinomycetes bacterium]
MSIRVVGVIGKPHGVKGFVTVRLYTDYPKSIIKGDILYTSPEGKDRLTVEMVMDGSRKDSILIKFLELADRNAAEQYRGQYLYRPEADSPHLETGQYWADDIPGCTVFEGDRFVGTVVQMLDLPANYVLSIDLEAGEAEKRKTKNILVPFIDVYIEKVNIGERKIILKKLPQYI